MINDASTKGIQDFFFRYFKVSWPGSSGQFNIVTSKELMSKNVN